MAPPPSLLLFLDGAPPRLLAPPDPIAPRSWILGVVAAQLSVEAGRPKAIVRAHVTGADAPTVIAVGERAVAHVALVAADEFGQCPDRLAALAPRFGQRLSRVAPPALAGAAARIALFLDGEFVGESALAPARLAESPRAFAHAWCRWLRDGGVEPGFDLTDFLALPPGEKFARAVSRPLAVGQVVSWGVALAGTS